jgi:hypothetical protein
VRLNFEFSNIRRFDASIILGAAPARAGLLIQNKKITYLFLAKRGIVFDSLHIFRYSDHKMTLMASRRAMNHDTSQISIYIKEDSLYFGIPLSMIAVTKPSDFSGLTAIGFECPKGSVKVLSTYIEAANKIVTDSFDKASLVNLHLDRIFRK